MSKFIGALANIGIAKEASRGTGEASASFWIPKMSMSVDDIIEKVIDENTIGVIEDSVDAKTVLKASECEIEGRIGDKSIGLLLYALFGSKAVSGPTDSAYTHTFTIGQSAQHQSLTLFQDDPNQDYTYALAMIKKFDINVELKKFAMFKIGFRAKAGATATLTPSYTAENSFLPQHGSIKIASTQAGLDAASAINIRAVKMSFNPNLEDDLSIGSLAPTDILNRQFSTEGELEIVFNDETFKTDLLADTAKALRVRLNNSDVLIGSTSTPVLTFDFHSVKFSEFKRNYGNGDVVTASVKFKAFYKMADSKMITCTLVNGQSSY